MVVNHAGLHLSVDHVGLGTRSDAQLDAAPDREILIGDDLDQEVKILLPVQFLLIGRRRRGHIETGLHHGPVDAAVDRENPLDLDVIALRHQQRIGKQQIHNRGVAHQAPLVLGLFAKAGETGPLLAEALGDVDVQYVWRFLRSHKIDLVARKSWCESNDPNFTAKAADVVGLYVAPPAKAIVLCVDEKPSIQALERAQGYLKLPNGRALTGQSHDYKRHGTTTLFAALEVATGRIISTHSKRRRRVEFLDFMNSVTAAFPNRKLHVIHDNLNTHKKNEGWLKAHPNVQFHFTPTSASWLNQVEVWFSLFQGQSLSGTSFTSLKQLQEHIDAYVNASNDRAEPFVWTKKKVRQRRFKGRRITQL